MKNSPISLRVHPEIKKKLKNKSEQLGLTLTGFLEKIANEPIVFLDQNTKTLIEALRLNSSV